jgi:predicted permease
VSLDAAQRRLSEVSASLAKQYPDDDGGIGVALQPIQAAFVQDAALLMNLLIAACLCILMIAAANVASLVLARRVAQRRELAIRAALGGGWWRLTRQLITEQLVLSIVAGAAAIGPAWLALRFITSFHLSEVPNMDAAGLNTWVLAFNFAVASIVGLVCGVAPAWLAWRSDLNSTLKSTPTIDAGRPQQRLRKVFVISQVALTMVLLVAGGLVLRSFLDILSAPPGYGAERMLAMRVALSSTQYGSPERQVAFFDRVVHEAAAIPGVAAVSATEELPLSDSLHGSGLMLARRPDVRTEDLPIVLHTAVLPGYFAAMEIPLVRGRWFTSHDVTNAPLVAVIDRWTATTYWPGGNPIGERIRLGRTQPWLEIVGVVGEVEAPVVVRFLKGRIGQVYCPLAQDPTPAMSLVLRATGDETTLVAPVRALVRRIDPDQPVFAVGSLLDQRIEGRSIVRLVMGLLNGFAVIALLLATVGLYGTIAYDVRQRTREFGLRMSLGAEPADVLATVLRDGTKLLAAGLTFGIVGALGAISFVTNAVSGIRARDPITLLGSVALLALTGLLASYVPARRATRISPSIALRAE